MYDKFFYRNQVENSYSSAEIFAKFIATIFKPKSVVDVGCDKGVWLKAFDEQFQCDTVGVEGKWLKREELVYKPSIFLNKDLNASLYVREGSKSHDLLTHNGYKALTNYYFLDLVDLDLYMKRIKPAGYIKYWIAKILPSKLVALLHGIFK